MLSIAESKRPLVVMFPNSGKMPSAGVRWEALVVGSIVSASHRNSFAGAPFCTSVSALLYELGIVVPRNTPLDFRTSMKDNLEPFLAPPDVNWPDFLTRDLELRISM